MLNQSARFHSLIFVSHDVTLMHPSPCTLNTDVATSGCTGDPEPRSAPRPYPTACAACANPSSTNDLRDAPPSFASATSPAARASAPPAEVAAAGYGDPIAVVDGWMDEAAGSDGHRKILTDQGTTANTMGYGHASGSNCWKTFDVGDSGNLQQGTHPRHPHRGGQPRQRRRRNVPPSI